MATTESKQSAEMMKRILLPPDWQSWWRRQVEAKLFTKQELQYTTRSIPSQPQISCNAKSWHCALITYLEGGGGSKAANTNDESPGRWWW